MDLIEFLESDHDKFRCLLDKLDRQVLDSPHKFQEGWPDRAGRETLALIKEFMGELDRHEEIERRLLYPSLARSGAKGKERIDLIEKDHVALDGALGRLSSELAACSDKPASWLIVKVLDLVEDLPRHMDVEEKELFTLARKSIPAAELRRLGLAAQTLRVREAPL